MAQQEHRETMFPRAGAAPALPAGQIHWPSEEPAKAAAEASGLARSTGLMFEAPRERPADDAAELRRCVEDLKRRMASLSIENVQLRTALASQTPPLSTQAPTPVAAPVVATYQASSRSGTPRGNSTAAPVSSTSSTRCLDGSIQHMVMQSPQIGFVNTRPASLPPNMFMVRRHAPPAPAEQLLGMARQTAPYQSSMPSVVMTSPKQSFSTPRGWTTSPSASWEPVPHVPILMTSSSTSVLTPVAPSASPRLGGVARSASAQVLCWPAIAVAPTVAPKQVSMRGASPTLTTRVDHPASMVTTVVRRSVSPARRAIPSSGMARIEPVTVFANNAAPPGSRPKAGRLLSAVRVEPPVANMWYRRGAPPATMEMDAMSFEASRLLDGSPFQQPWRLQQDAAHR